MDGDVSMSLYQFANNANTTLGSAINTTATTITVATGTGVLFPTLTGGQYFTATLFAAGSSTGLPNEIVRVTARTGDTMTVVRGQEGTTPQSWAVGASFSNFITAGLLNNLVGTNDIQSQFGNSAVDSGSTNAGVVTLSPAITSLSSILYSPIRVLKIGTANTGAYTLNVNGLGAKNVLINGSALQNNQLAASAIFEVVWDGTNFELMSNPAALVLNSIPNSSLAQMPASTFKGNITTGTATPSDIPISSLLTSLGFGSYSLAYPGYYTFPNGLIVQWGQNRSVTPGNGYVIPITFPVTFPHSVLAMSVVPYTPSGTTYVSKHISRTNTGSTTSSVNMTVINDDSDIGSFYGFDWVAIGW